MLVLDRRNTSEAGAVLGGGRHPRGGEQGHAMPSLKTLGEFDCDRYASRPRCRVPTDVNPYNVSCRALCELQLEQDKAVFLWACHAILFLLLFSVGEIRVIISLYDVRSLLLRLVPLLMFSASVRCPGGVVESTDLGRRSSGCSRFAERPGRSVPRAGQA